MNAASPPLLNAEQATIERTDSRRETYMSDQPGETGPSILRTREGIPAFLPLACTVLYLDLSQMFEYGIRDGYFDGTLPFWLRHFTHLRELRAQNLELLYLEPFITDLKDLRVIHLDNNLISTWPYFLCELPHIEYISLNNNPCLKKMCLKSPTFKQHYHNWQSGSNSNRRIPDLIRGPEWMPAASARSAKFNVVSDLGYYCGGIYTQSTPPDISNNGLFTPLGPCPLHKRRERLIRTQFEFKHGTMYSYSPVSRCYQTYGSGIDEYLLPQYKILISFFQDLKSLFDTVMDTSPKKMPAIKYVSVFASVGYDVKCQEFNPGSHAMALCAPSSQSLVDLPYWVSQLLAEDTSYVCILHAVLERLRKDPVSNATAISVLGQFKEHHVNCLSQALAEFIPILSSKDDDMIDQFIQFLSEYARKLSKIYTEYALNIVEMEENLEACLPTLKKHKSKGLEQHVEKYMNRVSTIKKLMHNKDGSSSGKGNSGLNELDLCLDDVDLADFEENYYSKSMNKFGEWISCQLGLPHLWSPCLATTYLYTPLFRLVRLDCFYHLFASADSRFDEVSEIFNTCRSQTVAYIETSRLLFQVQRLSQKYKCSTATFDGYKWDTCVAVETRTYLEKGILVSNTDDVVSLHTGECASAVKEIFSSDKRRELRIVNCHNMIMVWDRLFKKLVMTTLKDNMIVTPCDKQMADQSAGGDQKVNIMFTDFGETMLASVLDFRAINHTSEDCAKELLEAMKFDKKLRL